MVPVGVSVLGTLIGTTQTQARSCVAGVPAATAVPSGMPVIDGGATATAGE